MKTFGFSRYSLLVPAFVVVVSLFFGLSMAGLRGEFCFWLGCLFVIAGVGRAIQGWIDFRAASGEEDL